MGSEGHKQLTGLWQHVGRGGGCQEGPAVVRGLPDGCCTHSPELSPALLCCPNPGVTDLGWDGDSSCQAAPHITFSSSSPAQTCLLLAPLWPRSSHISLTSIHQELKEIKPYLFSHSFKILLFTFACLLLESLKTWMIPKSKGKENLHMSVPSSHSLFCPGSLSVPSNSPLDSSSCLAFN